MNPSAARPLSVRLFAILLTVLLAVTGFALPAHADEASIAGTSVEETSPSEDADADQSDSAGSEPAEIEGDGSAPDVGADDPEELAEDETLDEALPDDEGEADAAEPSAAFVAQFFAAAVAAGNVDDGTAAWSISDLLGRSVAGFAAPLPSGYAHPATFTAGTPGVSTWGAAVGTVAPDGSATLEFEGASVNHATTGGGWLRLSDLQVELDAEGNGVVKAVVAYGTATGGAPGNRPYDASEAPVRGPVLLDIVTLAGNTAAQASIATATATWTDLSGSWTPDFLTFVQGIELPGVSPAAPKWAYDTAITGPTATTGGSAGLTRTPAPFTFALNLASDPVEPVTFDDGSLAWSISELLGRSVLGFAGPLASGYVEPATFSAGAPGVSTWGGGSGEITSDGSATLAFRGTSVNHATTGGGWLRISDVQAELDADGNGVVTAVVAYGTATGGAPGNRPYDASEAPVRGPVRIDIVTLAGNAPTQVAVSAETATWTNLSGSWSPDFRAFVEGTELPGVSPAAEKWAYDTAITGATATTGGSAGLTRTPAPLTFSLGMLPPVEVITPTVNLGTSPSGGAVQGSTVVLTSTVAPAADGTVEFRSGSTVLGTVPVTAALGTAVLNVSNLGVATHNLVAVFTPADPVHVAGATSSGVTFEVSAPVVAAPGFLSWGVKSTFRTYITGPAHGTVTLGAGAGLVGGVYRFPQAGGSTFDTASGLGAAAYRGSVAFWGHDGALSLTLSDPVVRVTAPSTAVLSTVAAGSGRIDLATLNLAAGGRSVDASGAVTYTNVPTTLTSAGASAFSGFYEAGEALDPVSFVIGSPANALGGGTVSSSSSGPVNTPDPTPPATEGVTSPGTRFTEGGSATFTADGFQPNEPGILAVIYSEPTVLADDLTADAAGTVTWTGDLPVGLTGEHTFTFQGSVDRGMVLDIAAAEVVGCFVEGAELTWGFKEAFRAYVDGSIASGEWTTTDGATYETPHFTWPTGTGGYDAETGDADLAFAGSVRFTGHGGVLDTTISNLRIVIDGDRAVLLLDVTGTTREGTPVSSTGVEFAELDLAAAERVGGGDLVAFTGIPATLTPAGAAAFGTYEAGSDLDPIDLSITVGAACAQPAGEVTTTSGELAVESAGDSSLVLWIVLAAVLALVLVVVAVLLVRRGRRTA